MKILVHFESFDAGQIEHLKQIARDHGNHELIQATTEEEALEHAPAAEAILGHFTQSVCAVAVKLRWIQSYSAGMNSFLFPEIVERDQVLITNMAGLYAPQGGEHAWRCCWV